MRTIFGNQNSLVFLFNTEWIVLSFSEDLFARQSVGVRGEAQLILWNPEASSGLIVDPTPACGALPTNSAHVNLLQYNCIRVGRQIGMVPNAVFMSSDFFFFLHSRLSGLTAASRITVVGGKIKKINDRTSCPAALARAKTGIFTSSTPRTRRPALLPIWRTTLGRLYFSRSFVFTKTVRTPDDNCTVFVP